MKPTKAQKQTVSLAQKGLRERCREFGHDLVEVPEEDWPPALPFPSERYRVLRNNRFLVQLHRERGMVRISVNKTELDRNATLETGDWVWHDGITWDELQSIKNECGFDDRCAIEVFPPRENVVNIANMRHLWVMPRGFDVHWKLVKKEDAE